MTDVLLADSSPPCPVLGSGVSLKFSYPDPAIHRDDSLLSSQSEASPPTPDPHQRTRRDHALETAEDYVEAVAEFIDTEGRCRVGDLATYFGVSHVTVSRIVGRLAGEGFLKTEPYRPITLTSKGRKLAEKSRKRHQIVHEFLLALGVDDATASLDAEGIEHHVSPETLKKLQALTKRLNDDA
ncbi:MAG: manganese-binding transcriptional regulator MntR [Planctomycetota bacterium]